MNVQGTHFYDFGPFRLDVTERLLLRDGESLTLTPKAFETLLALAENSGHLIEKDDLLKRLWPDTFVEEANLANNISLLRKVLGDNPKGHQYIETVPKRGYRFAAGVREVWGDGAEMAAKRVVEHGRDPSKAIDSLAVLPLNNTSADASIEFLSDGITESIINSLSQLHELRVMARSTVFSYKGKEVDPRQVGRDLHVGAVLTGRVLQFGDRLVINTELVDTAGGWQLWGAQYNREPSDIFAVQEEISREIAEALRLRLTSEERRRLAKRYTENTAAYQAYLKGRYYLNKETGEAARKSLEYFNEAIEKDPSYALAYAGLADSYRSLGAEGVLAKECYSKARKAAERALEIDDALAEAHTSLATICWEHDWDCQQAERHFKRAIELNPNYATTHQWYSEFLAYIGRSDEAIAEAKRAQELDLLSLMGNAILGQAFYLARRYDEAIEQYKKTLEMDPHFGFAHFFLGLAYIQKGMYEKAISEIQKARILLGRMDIVGALGYAYAVSGKRDEAQKLLDELHNLSKMQYVPPIAIAVVYTGLGEKDRAFEWLENAYEERSWHICMLKEEPLFDSLRPDPRSTGLLRRIGFQV